MLMEASRGETLAERIDDMLGRAMLSAARESSTDSHRVNLLTLHSTKGLEFSRVYIVGVEDQRDAGVEGDSGELEEEIQEARRLLYVGMTRAKDRLVLTRAERREGRAIGRRPVPHRGRPPLLMRSHSILPGPSHLTTGLCSTRYAPRFRIHVRPPAISLPRIELSRRFRRHRGRNI